MDNVEFKNLLNSLSNAWQRKDYQAAVDIFAENIEYRDPLRYSLSGKMQLRAFFEDDEGYPQHTVWHHIIFDDQQQIGVAEYTFNGTHRYHGAVIIKVQDGLITRWREYQHIDSREWQEFAAGTIF
jgi:ketosteroid isomerase-like protein